MAAPRTAAPVRPPGIRHDDHQGLRGDPRDQPAPQPTASGWHPTDWACEAVGTAFQLFVGFGAVALLEAPQSSVRADLPSWLRLVLLGVVFGALAAAVALSPVGRRSGAHLNPAVTLGFFLRKHTSWRDLLGYAGAQTAGALVAAAVFRVVWGSWAAGVHTARTVPAGDLPGWGVAGIEAALTFGLLTVVFLMVSSPRTARLAPVAVTGALAGLIWAGAGHTGASMNPSRTFGPDVVAGAFGAFWAYVVGPLAGAVAAALGFSVLGRERRTLTAKLYHDPAYPSVHATSLPARPHRGTNQTAGAGDASPRRPARTG
ncbi:MAG TPA: aquaporin [Acidimicrobiales bacterium]|nr:aquaporin [Acidimicrobiales bacterium]